jgi:hypothetical protein
VAGFTAAAGVKWFTPTRHRRHDSQSAANGIRHLARTGEK